MKGLEQRKKHIFENYLSGKCRGFQIHYQVFDALQAFASVVG